MGKGFVTQLGELIDRQREASSGDDWRKWLPSRGNIVFVILAFALFTWAQHAGAIPGLLPTATSTHTISYQGRLADVNGNPLTGVYNLEFRLYVVPAGGAPLWEEFWTGGNSVQVSDGLFNVMLGSLNPALVSAIEGQGDLFLGITVGTDSEMVPRVQLGSVPFAMQSLTVPDGSITSAKIANGAITSEKLDASSAYSYVQNQESTTAITPTPLSMPDIVTITLPIGQLVNVIYEATVDSNPSRPAFISLSVNGSGYIDATLIEDWGGSGATTITGVYQVELPAGTHTIQMMYSTQSEGIATFWRRKLLAYAISQ